MDIWFSTFLDTIFNWDGPYIKLTGYPDIPDIYSTIWPLPIAVQSLILTALLDPHQLLCNPWYLQHSLTPTNCCAIPDIYSTPWPPPIAVQSLIFTALLDPHQLLCNQKTADLLASLTESVLKRLHLDSFFYIKGTIHWFKKVGRITVSIFPGQETVSWTSL